jgi:MOSC domain-containing protein YiiM
MAVTAKLQEFYGHLLCGIYVQITRDGEVAEGDTAALQGGNR